MKLLLDLGNTRLKWATADGARLCARGACDWDDHAVGPLRALLCERPFSGAWLASVTSPERVAAVLGVLRKFNLAAQMVGPPVSRPALRLAYADPAMLGVDRWLGMCAARTRWSGPVLVASCGSALTIDAVNADGEHLGGTIAPSPARMREALLQRAPHLKHPPGQITAFANNTADAVHSGAVLAAAALIDRMAEQMAHRLQRPPNLILTGGGAAELQPWLLFPSEREDALVLLGLLDESG